MTEKEKTRVSTFISLVLRHKPEEIGESLDANGWMKTSRLLRGLRTKYPKLNLTHDDIRDIVNSDEKQRYTLSDGDLSIRANQGHSVELSGSTVTEAIPPDVLYHGTAWKSVGAILERGLLPMSRIHVHLSENLETALKVGSRHGNPVIVQVDAQRAAAEGYVFYRSDNEVWLTDKLPAHFLHIGDQIGVEGLLSPSAA